MEFQQARQAGLFGVLVLFTALLLFGSLGLGSPLHLRLFGSDTFGSRLLGFTLRTLDLLPLDRSRFHPAGWLLRTLGLLPLDRGRLYPAGWLLDLRCLFFLDAFPRLRRGPTWFDPFRSRRFNLPRSLRFGLARRAGLHLACCGLRLRLTHFRRTGFLFAASSGIRLPTWLWSHLAFGLGFHFRRGFRLAPALRARLLPALGRWILLLGFGCSISFAGRWAALLASGLDGGFALGTLHRFRFFPVFALLPGLLRGAGCQPFRRRFALARTIGLSRDDRRATDLHAGRRGG